MTKDEWLNRLVQARLNLEDAEDRRQRKREAYDKARRECEEADAAWDVASRAMDKVVRAAGVDW